MEDIIGKLWMGVERVSNFWGLKVEGCRRGFWISDGRLTGLKGGGAVDGGGKTKLANWVQYYYIVVIIFGVLLLWLHQNWRKYEADRRSEKSMVGEAVSVPKGRARSGKGDGAATQAIEDEGGSWRRGPVGALAPRCGWAEDC